MLGRDCLHLQLVLYLARFPHMLLARLLAPLACITGTLALRAGDLCKQKPESCSEALLCIRAREDATLQFLKEVRILKK